MKLDFEILISKFKEKYRAICPDFPECVGNGDNEDEAISDLGDAITLHLGSTIRRTIADAKKLGLVRYMADDDTDDKDDDRLSPFIANNNAQEKEGKIIFSGKMPIPTEWLNKMDKKQMGSKAKKLLGIGTLGLGGYGPGASSNPLLPSLFEEMQSPYSSELLDDALLFGVPLSLN